MTPHTATTERVNRNIRNYFNSSGLKMPDADLIADDYTRTDADGAMRRDIRALERSRNLYFDRNAAQSQKKKTASGSGRFAEAGVEIGM